MFRVIENNTPSRVNRTHFFEYLIWAMLALGLLLKCIYFQFSTDISKKPYLSAININMLLSQVSLVFILAGTVLLFFNKRRLTALVVTYIMLSLILASDIIYFRYFFTPVTVASLYQIGLIFSIGKSIASLLKTSDLVFVLDMLMIPFAVLLAKRSISSSNKRLKPARRLLAAICIISSGIVILAAAYNNSSPGTFPYDNNYVVNNLGILYFHCYDINRYVKENILTNRTLDSDERLVLESFFRDSSSGLGDSSSSDHSGDSSSGLGDSSSSHHLGDSSLPLRHGFAKGMNLIIVQLEAIQNFVIGLKFNGKEITPNLNNFISDSIYLDNFYYQVGTGNTSDAEFLVNNSLYPLKSGSVYFRYPNNTYRSLPKYLGELGYTSYVFHANNPSFWNRTEMYRSMGFDHFISNRDYEMDEYLGWSLSDISFFRQSLEKIDYNAPFYGFFITLTSHHPYNYFDTYNKFDAGAYEGTMAGNYAEAAHYVDTAVGIFLEDLKSRSLYDNSVIVIYGDHHAVPRDQTDMLSDLINFSFTEYNWTKLQRVPCFIRYPGMNKDERGVVSTICGQIDLLPTIANLMGFNCTHSLGKDIFNTKNGYAVLRNGSVIADGYVYSAADDSTYDNNGQKLDNNPYDVSIKQYSRILEVSEIILKKNAFDELS